MNHNSTQQKSTLAQGFKKLSLFQKILWISVIALIILGGSGFAYYRLAYLPAQTAASTGTQIQTAVIRQGDLVIYASGSGTLIAQSSASFGFETSGQVTKVNVQVGDVVEAGQVLAELNSDSATLAYQQAKRALDELTSPAAIATAQQAVATAQDTLSTSREALAYLISPAVLTWREHLTDAEIALAQAQAEATANPSDAASKKVQEAQAAMTLAQNNLAVAEKDYPAYIKATFTETVTDPRTGEAKIVYYVDATGKRYTNVFVPSDTAIASAQAAYDLAKATVKETETYLAALNGEEIPEGATGASLGTFIAAQENLLAAETALKNTQLTAPISGTIMTLTLNTGDYVSSGTAIATISDLAQPSLEVFLDETDWNNVRVGNEAEASFDILANRTFAGKVAQVDPGLYSLNGTSVVRAIVTLDSVDASFNLPLGTSGSVDVIGGRATNVVLVPIEALNQNGSQYFVYVMENGVPTKRVVEIGIQDTLYAEVTSGLKSGDVVATNYTEPK
jgi:multidrug efflux pump subunit AcrA (membrane-fusion protein)